MADGVVLAQKYNLKLLEGECYVFSKSIEKDNAGEDKFKKTKNNI